MTDETKRYFRPEPDITAYELSWVFANISGIGPPKHGVWFTTEQWDGLSDGLRRHFKEK